MQDEVSRDITASKLSSRFRKTAMSRGRFKRAVALFFLFLPLQLYHALPSLSLLSLHPILENETKVGCGHKGAQNGAVKRTLFDARAAPVGYRPIRSEID